MPETCTCGERAGQLAHYDVTWYCETDRHSQCSEVLSAATGFHWACACECHPEPPAFSKQTDPRDVQRALDTWRRAREQAAQAAR